MDVKAKSKATKGNTQMNPDTLLQKVEAAVNAKMNNREHFTTVDISKPIIDEDNSVRHCEVRQILDDMWSTGDVEEAGFAVGHVTVYPQHLKGRGMQVRLFHPDDPTYDPSTYTATHQEVNRDAPVATRGFDMDTDGDDGTSGSDSVPVITQTSTGAAVTKQCQIQSKNGTLNIPVSLVRSAGFRTGEDLNISINGSTVEIRKTTSGHNPGTQRVDDENRIRLHGTKVMALNKGVAVPCTAMVVEPAGGARYIQVQ